MQINELLNQGKEIWKGEKLSLNEIIPRIGKVFGDICRWERNEPKDKDVHTDEELMKELGNLIFSTIKWCDELEYDPEECIKLAIQCQKKFKK